MESKKRMLLHCCCAPCASYVIEHLAPEYDITAFYYNPNVEPEAEYEKRKSEFLRFLSEASYASDVDFLESEYDNNTFAAAVWDHRNQPEGGARCRICYDLRLRKTAQRAASGRYDIFATTMSISPQKNAKLLNELGAKASDEFVIEYLSADFKKNNGYLRSVELSNQFGLYRQEYCGCEA